MIHIYNHACLTLSSVIYTVQVNLHVSSPSKNEKIVLKFLWMYDFSISKNMASCSYFLVIFLHLLFGAGRTYVNEPSVLVLLLVQHLKIGLFA